MKKLFFLFTLFLLPIFLFSQGQKVYKVVLRTDWKPYYFIDSKGKPTGYGVELFESIAKVANIRYEYVMANSFQDLLMMLKEGKADIIPNISIVASRESLLLFTQPTDDFLINIYKKSSSTDIVSPHHIQNKKVGLVSKNICTRLLDKTYQNITKIYYSEYKELMKGLLNDEIDVFCYPEPLIELANGNKSIIVPLDKSLEEIKRGVGVTKSNFELLPKLDEAITELKLTGQMAQLHEKWFGKKKFIELTRSETLFIVASFFGISFTTLVVILYFISKKKWLLTQQMLKDEVKLKTERYRTQNKKLRTLQKKLKEQLNKDSLTCIYNRNFYNQKMDELLSLYHRHQTIFSFCIFDIDDFKKINDEYGHPMGDKVLLKLTQVVQKHIRITDYFCRVGGEEFVIFFSDTSLDDACLVAEALRQVIEKKVNVLKERSVSVSMGVSEVSKDDTPESLYKRADLLLYQAKQQGKNQVVRS